MSSTTAVGGGTINPNKALWEKGDFTRIAGHMRASGEAVVDSLGITRGLAVLDLGCGDGTTALPAARRGADVLGVDIAANLVAAGNARAKVGGLATWCFRKAMLQIYTPWPPGRLTWWSACPAPCWRNS